jgi:hypothetical protein
MHGQFFLHLTPCVETRYGKISLFSFLFFTDCARLQVIVEKTKGGVDYAFECTGNQKVMRTAFESCRGVSFYNSNSSLSFGYQRPVIRPLFTLSLTLLLFQSILEILFVFCGFE